MKLLVFLIMAFSAIEAGAQWEIVRERLQEDGNHTYIALASSDGLIIYTCGAVDASTDEYLIEKSTDGGINWTRQNTEAFPNFPVALNDKLHDIAALGDNCALVVGDSGLIAT